MKEKWTRLCAAAAMVLIAGVAALTGCVTTGGGNPVEDPQGRFAYQADPELRPQPTDGSYDHYTLESPAMEVYVVAVEAPSEQTGEALAFQRIGRDFTSYVRRHVFAPAGMQHTAYSTAGLAGAPEALPVVTPERLASTESLLEAGGLAMDGFVAYRTEAVAHLQPFDILPCWAGVKSTAADAALFGWLFLNGGRVAGNSVLESSTVRQMLRVQKSTDGKPLGFGLAWHLGRQGQEGIVEHAGGGAGIDSLLRLYPKRGLAIAVLGNMNGYGPGRVAEFTAALLRQTK